MRLWHILASRIRSLGASVVAVVGHEAWKRKFRADPFPPFTKAGAHSMLVIKRHPGGEFVHSSEPDD